MIINKYSVSYITIIAATTMADPRLEIEAKMLCLKHRYADTTCWRLGGERCTGTAHALWPCMCHIKWELTQNPFRGLS